MYLFKIIFIFNNSFFYNLLYFFNIIKRKSDKRFHMVLLEKLKIYNIILAIKNKKRNI